MKHITKSDKTDVILSTILREPFSTILLGTVSGLAAVLG
jgi:hypothetical protein